MIVATIMCGQCRAEHRSEPRKLGSVERNDYGDLVWNGYVSATVWPRSWVRPIPWIRGDLTRREARELREPRILTSPQIERVYLPPELPVFCRQHGPGSVATSDVVGKRGIVFVNIATE